MLIPMAKTRHRQRILLGIFPGIRISTSEAAFYYFIGKEGGVCYYSWQQVILFTVDVW